MNKYLDKDRVLKEIQETVLDNTNLLHPTDKVDVLREISDWTKNEAEMQDYHNDKVGVPERVKSANTGSN
jgi:hypothetical protein